jgi:hypothetical protein
MELQVLKDLRGLQEPQGLKELKDLLVPMDKMDKMA